MDNFSQPDDEKDLEQVVPTSQEGSDIEFDELVDLDDIQKKLKEHMQTFDGPTDEYQAPDVVGDGFGFDAPAPDADSSFGDKSMLSELSDMKKNAAEVDPNAKKYVIYVDPENIDLMESLSASDKKIVLNRLLKEQKESVQKKKKAEEQQQFFINSMIVTLTVIIGFPLMFITVNKSLQVTLDNFQQARENFVKLYRQKGKIKQGDDSSNVNYNY